MTSRKRKSFGNDGEKSAKSANSKRLSGDQVKDYPHVPLLTEWCPSCKWFLKELEQSVDRSVCTQGIIPKKRLVSPKFSDKSVRFEKTVLPCGEPDLYLSKIYDTEVGTKNLHYKVSVLLACLSFCARPSVNHKLFLLSLLSGKADGLCSLLGPIVPTKQRARY